jgi:small subunit ribosomal protein S12
MVTFRQIYLKKQERLRKYHRCRTPSLKKCPQKKGLVTSIVIIKPKKPNSARRHIAKMRLSTRRKARAAMPGEYDKRTALRPYSKVLVRGGRIRDIVGIRYKVILGKLDAVPFKKRKTSRSKYGVKRRKMPEVFDHFLKLKGLTNKDL